MAFVPTVGHVLSIQLPGEMVRATVARVVNDDTVICVLNQGIVLAKSHRYRFNDAVSCRRVKNALGQPVWQSVEGRLAHTPPPAPKVEEVKKDAATPGLEPQGRKREHSRDDRKRVSAKAGRGGKPVKRPKAPKAARGPIAF